MKPGEDCTGRIEKLVPRGKGIFRLDGKAVFIPFVCPGEEVEGVIREVRKDYSLADKKRILKISPHRADPFCRYFETCGGCQWQMIEYREQLRQKSLLLGEALERTGKIRLDVPPAVPSRSSQYRSKARFHTGICDGSIRIGYLKGESKEFVPVESCSVLVPALERLLSDLLSSLNSQPEFLTGIAEIIFLASADEKETVLEFRGEALESRQEIFRALLGLSGTVRGIVLSEYGKASPRVIGKKYIENRYNCPNRPDRVFRLRSSIDAFLQCNWEMNIHLISVLLEWAGLTGKERIIELYCGNGNFTLPLALNSGSVTCVEEHASACEDLLANLRMNGISNVQARKGSAQSVLGRWDRNRHPVDLVVADPPREGLDRQTLRSLIRIAPDRILYLSCDPVTLARDLKSLAGLYSIRRILPFDLFPQTAHIESLTELSREGFVR